MDLGFPRCRDDAEPAPLDHAMFVAALEAQKAAEAKPAAASGSDHPLVELILAGPQWRRALSAQGGCFSRAEAGRRVNGA